jgi:hypothetical protein
MNKRRTERTQKPLCPQQTLGEHRSLPAWIGTLQGGCAVTIDGKNGERSGDLLG